MKDHFLYILFLFVGNLSIAQSPYAVQFKESNGLPTNSIYAVFQDSKGFVWASGDEGLAKFAGKRWQTFKADNQSQLSGSNIEEDQYGRIWYENFDGHLFYVFANKMYALNQNAPLNFYNYGITKKHLFVIQRNGIDVFDLKSLKHKKLIIKNQYDVNSSFSDGVNFYIITENEILIINEDLNVSKTTFINDNKRIFPSLYGANNSLIAKELTVDKVQVFQFSSNLKQYKNIALPIEGNLNGIKFFDNQYWVLSSNGLYLFDHLSDTNPKVYFKGKNISSCVKDRQGNFWIATINEGLFLLPNM